MSDITISPIPYYGGTLQTNYQQCHYCYLGNGKFLHVIAQTGPNYVYAFVSNQANLVSGTFSTSAATTRVIMSGSTAPSTITSIRLFKLTATSAAMMMNGTMYALTIDGSDNVTLKNGTATGVVSTSVSANPNLGGYGYGTATTGSYWQVFAVRDNTLFVLDRYSGTGSYFMVAVRKVVYNPTTDSFTVTTLATYNASVPFATYNNYSFSRYYVQDIPGSNTKLLSIRMFLNATAGNTAGLGGSFIVWAALVDQTDAVTVLPLPATNCAAMVPLSTTNILGLPAPGGQQKYLVFNGTSWTTTLGTYAPTYNGNYYLLQAEALDSSYFVVYSIQYNQDLSANGINFQTRIARFVDQNYGQTSTATSANSGLQFQFGQMALFDQQFIIRDSTSTFLMLGKTGTIAPYIHTIYQPGACARRGRPGTAAGALFALALV